MVSAPEQNSQKRLALNAVTNHPTEDVLYAIFNEFVTLHQQQHRFAIYPQMSLKWKPHDPQDRRSEVPDFGLGNFTPPGVLPHFKLRCGVEAKRADYIMASLPAASSIMDSLSIASLFHSLSFQAENQAKAAYKNGYPLSDNGVDWILLIGPYWLPKRFGPFSDAENTVRAYKMSDSADFEETMNLIERIRNPPSPLDELYLLGTEESYTRLEQIIASTDQLAQPFIQAMSAGMSLQTQGCMSYINRATRSCVMLLVSTWLPIGSKSNFSNGTAVLNTIVLSIRQSLNSFSRPKLLRRSGRRL